MLTPFFLAISSILPIEMHENGVVIVTTCKHYLFVRFSRKEVSYMSM